MVGKEQSYDLRYEAFFGTATNIQQLREWSEIVRASVVNGKISSADAKLRLQEMYLDLRMRRFGGQRGAMKTYRFKEYYPED